MSLTTGIQNGSTGTANGNRIPKHDWIDQIRTSILGKATEDETTGSVLYRSYIRFWKYGMLGMTVLMFCLIGSEGLRFAVNMLGKKLSSLPLLSMLGEFEETAKLDLAHLVSLVVGFAVCHLWYKNIKVYLFPSEPLPGSAADAPERHLYLVRGLGIALLGADALLFLFGLLGFSEGTWSTDGIGTFGALIVSVCYTGMLIFSAYYTCILERRIA